MARILNANTDVTLGGENASNEVVSSQKAIKSYVDNKFGNSSFKTTCPAITPVSGIATWVITHNLGSSDIICTLYNDDGAEIVKNTTINSPNQITVTFNTISNVSAGDYTIIILASGGSSGGGSVIVDSTLSTTSTNPVQNSVITNALNNMDTLPSVSGNSGKFLTTDGTVAVWETIPVDSTLSTTSTNPVQNSIIYSTLNSYVRHISTTGEIVTSEGDNARGAGSFFVTLYGNGKAVIQYTYKITTAGSSTSNFKWGISPTLLHNKNSNIPIITPVGGGVCIVYESNGYISTAATEYSGYHDASQGYWTYSRVYNTTGNTGAFPSNICTVGRYFVGTCYGTYTV